MTTTGLSKYRGLIAAICPRVIMVEEAAETMEAPVTAGCVPSLEHLILVGDHKQLRPQCGVKLLEQEPFLLNVSMFERLVENKLPYKMLKRQRRMIPEIRRLLGPIYKNDIKDHILMRNPEVRPPVPGMGGINSFFYTHSWPDSVDDQMSSTNLQEADMVVGFYDYLISNGLKETEITVLCFYNGQRKLLLRRLRNHIRLKRMGHNPARIFKVLTVDSYQGEENEVVLLSLVRSNDQGKIGFLGVENRICVALSRAKRGFYMFGNAELLACESKLWAKVVNIMLADTSVMYEDRNPVSEPFGRVVFRVPLRCSKHCREMYIENVDDWDKIAGGCSLPCSEILKCGHHCHLNCHPFGHEKAICFEPCAKVLSCGHQCGRECYDQCRCTLCGNQRLENGGGVTRDESESSGSHGSNARAWQEFAKGGVRPHDAALRAMQRENYLQEQITLNLGADAASYQSSEMQNTTEDRKSTDPHSSIPAIRGSALLVDPAPLLVDSGALVTGSPSHLIGEPPATSAATAPTRKVKVSHRNRFKRSAPTATPIATSRAAAPVVATPAVMSAPPVDYTGAPTLQAPLEPLCLVHNDPLSARTASFETVVMPKCAEGAAAKYDGESLIDFD